MKSLLEYSKELRQLYQVDKKSIRQIATILHSYPIAVYRALKELGIPIRDKSEAAKEALDSGRSIHPTKGKNLSEDTKERIGKSVSKTWNAMSQDKRDEISQKHKEIWSEKTDAEKEELSKKSHAAIAESARIGSKLERFLYGELNRAGYDCHRHLKILENSNLEVDLALPKHKIAIELDGPSHFSPIWGQDIYQKTLQADQEKNGLLNINGFKVIRVIYTKSHVSNVLRQQVLKELLATIESVRTSQAALTYLKI